LEDCLKQLKDVQVEGVLTETYLLKHTTELLNLTRNCNHALRWRMLHRHSTNPALRDKAIARPSQGALLNILLQLSQFENTLKTMLSDLIEGKETMWNSGKETAVELIMEVSEYFTGERQKHTKVKKDDDLHKWFSTLAEQLNGLNYVADKAGSTGRKIQGIITALEDVEQFDAVDTNIQIKSYLSEVKTGLRRMIQNVNVKNSSLSILENVSDLSFAWGTLLDYLDVFHKLIRKDPSAVVLLRSTVLKAASILDVPLVRIVAINSPDATSVAQYYSAQLVDFVRRVLGVIPKSVFEVLHEIVDIQTNKMVPVPIRLESQHLKDYAQLDLRFRLSALTHQTSVFTEGILLMEKTLVGVIQVDPRQILEEGLRRELVRRIANAFHSCLQFSSLTMEEVSKKLERLASTLDGLKNSIQYIQDYIDMPGLKIYQQEIARVINYNTEQEANRYLKKKTFDSASQYQNEAIPIPRFEPVAKDVTGSLTFMGRIMFALLTLTDASKTVYVPESSAWFNHPAPDQKKGQTVEVCGVQTFSLLEKSLSVIGMRGLDRLLAFRTVHELTKFVRTYEKDTTHLRPWIETFREKLSPDFHSPVGGMKVYMEGMKKLEPLMLSLLRTTLTLGQSQLIRRQLSNLLQFSCQLEAQLLSESLNTLNCGILSDVHAHYRQPDKFHYPPNGNPLLVDVTTMLDCSGYDDPMHKIYVTTQPIEGLPIVLFLFLLTYLRTLYIDKNFGTLARSKSKFGVDGVPMVLGCATLLRQFHPAAMEQLVAHLGQFVRISLKERDTAAAKTRLPPETANALFFLDQLCYLGYVSRATVYRAVPAYVFDSI
jgi:WASH complex subunit strumpellin